MNNKDSETMQQAVNVLTDNTADIYSRIVAARQSVRNFSPRVVAPAMIERVLNDARLSPSNANTQPWSVHIVSGQSRDKLSAAMLAAVMAGQFSPDFSYANDDYRDECLTRAQHQGQVYHEAMGVDRTDREARMALALKNYEFFGAPHVALLFMPSVGDNVRVAGDMGMFAQTFLLSLVANGLAGIPQTSVGMLADTARDVIGVDDSMKLLFAISFGFSPEKQEKKTPMAKACIQEWVRYHN